MARQFISEVKKNIPLVCLQCEYHELVHLIKNCLIFSAYCADSGISYDFLPIFSSTSNCLGVVLYQQQSAYCPSSYPTN